METINLETATLAGGCFWCTEAIFKRLKGVESVVSGYSGGNPPAGGEKPTYEQVSSGITGHAEAIQIRFDPKEISYKQLLDVFFALHDPTQMNRQGNDVGEQYRSAVFYHTSEQKRAVEKKTEDLESNSNLKGKIVTQVEPFKSFYDAEDYHKDYYDKNRSAGYCQIVIDPKIHKLYKDFGDLVIRCGKSI
ncbi:MAG: peptide-methionine (S)-S-oxide reductase [Candidatus Woykebacteria bacterium RBG_16_44_10]|uniref:Peptide methionine sulfoxide reductase MsrA n=1 Tax=Candidatus Woykebacteria bacterium RBG_16_44_10 TaxID=1802597 RepID=A0A1G1WCZ4_9BACT|nr:MAG: peptide-methionine (S)-S-oxide reductase [Candidatus Woykebacteria bacterium RBG_16_44_10]